MALTDLQREVLAVVRRLPQAHGFALAGGGAMLAHGLVDRPTQDLDLFTGDASRLGPLADALAEALRAVGMDVVLTRNTKTFRQLAVSAEGRHVQLDLAQDAQLSPHVTLAVGEVLSLDELAGDKTLALFGRAEARDLVDVAALATTLGRARLPELAAAKDRGFDLCVFADALRVAAARPDERYAGLGVTGARLAELRDWAVAWSAALSAAPPSAEPRG